MSTLEAFARDPELGPDALAGLVRDRLPLAAPVFAWDRGAIALLPFVAPGDVAGLASELESSLDIVVRPSVLEGSALFDSSAHRLRSALAAS